MMQGEETCIYSYLSSIPSIQPNHEWLIINWGIHCLVLY